MSELLSIKQLFVNLQNKNILQQLNLSLDKGEILGLVGASGCGKTTLLNAIAGFVEPSKGTLSIEGKAIVDQQLFVAPENRQVGMIFQDYALFPHLNVQENIAFGISKLPSKERTERINQLLSLLKLTDFSTKYMHQLSGGQQQRVAIARALAPQPKLLLLDEPFSNIDARLRTELMLEIRQLLKQLNITAIFVTHNKDEVFTFADKMAVMSQGKLLQVDSPTVICQQPNSWQVADFLQLGTWLPCQLDDKFAITALGKIELSAVTQSSIQVTSNSKVAKEPTQYLLIKPQHLILNDDAKVNAEVVHISITEQGYHYHLTSLDAETALAFNQISFYSDEILLIKQQVALTVKAKSLYAFYQ